MLQSGIKLTNTMMKSSKVHEESWYISLYKDKALVCYNYSNYKFIIYSMLIIIIQWLHKEVRWSETSDIAKVGTGKAWTQPILSSTQPILLLIKWVVLQIPPGTYIARIAVVHTYRIYSICGAYSNSIPVHYYSSTNNPILVINFNCSTPSNSAACTNF